MSRPMPPTPPPSPPTGNPWPEAVSTQGPPPIPASVPPPPPPALAPAPPPLSTVGLPARTVGSRNAANPTVSGTAQRSGSTAVAPAGTSRSPADGAEPKDSLLRNRLQQLKRKRNKRWESLRKIPGYELIESVWLRFTQVRDAGEAASVDEHKRELPALDG